MTGRRLSTLVLSALLVLPSLAAADQGGICADPANIRPPPAADQPDPATVAALGACDEEALYYGIGRPADPAAARVCAFAHRGGDQNDSFAGDALLMVIYANGLGAPRDFDVAIGLACAIGGAGAEIDGRISHLQALKDENWQGHDFSYCDDITSGSGSTDCAVHDARLTAAKRAARLAKLAERWTGGPAAGPFTALKTAASAFAESTAANEVGLRGTLHNAETIGRREEVLDGFADDLQALADGKPPQAEAGADARLNAAYRSLMKVPADQFVAANQEITQDDVKQTQRVWLKYRDAWAAFAAAAFPAIPRQTVIDWLTARRADELEQFVPE